MNRPTLTSRSPRTATAAGVLASVAAALMVAAPAAQAAPYDGTDPIATGCANGAITIGTRPIKSPQATFGTMEVRYSPSCQTNWIRANLNNSYENVTVTKWIDRPAQGNLAQAGSVDTDLAAVSSYGKQVYAPGATCVVASVDLSAGGNGVPYATSGRVQFC